MAKGLFITGTGTDIGKTYVTAILTRMLRKQGYDVGYYKAAISGANSIEESDAGYVNKVANIGEDPDLLLSYLYTHAVSPHLASRWEKRPIEKDIILQAWQKVTTRYPYVTVEGSGGIICPLRDDEAHYYSLENLIQWLHLPTLIVSPAGLGSINDCVLTACYLREKGLPTVGFLLNHYTDSPMEKDNIKMIEKLTNLPVLGTLAPEGEEIKGNVNQFISLYR